MAKRKTTAQAKATMRALLRNNLTQLRLACKRGEFPVEVLRCEEVSHQRALIAVDNYVEGE